jgi:hypothetical protein
MIIDIRPLKAKAIHFPEPTRSLIFTEPDRIDAKDFISKVCEWIKIAEMGRGSEK